MGRRRRIKPALMLRAAAVALCAGFCAGARAAEDGSPHELWLGPRGITIPLSSILAESPARPEPGMVLPRMLRDPQENPRSPLVPQWPWDFGGLNPPTLLSPPFDNPQTISPTQNFLAVTGVDPPGRFPPSPSGSAGAAQVAVFVDGRLRAFDKATSTLLLNIDADQFFDAVRGGSPTSSPQVRFDPLSQRWFLTAVTTAPASNRVLLAVSAGPDLLPSSVLTFFGFAQDAVTPLGNTAQTLADPSLGVDAQALYIGGNMLAAGVFVNTSCWVINKASALGPGPLAGTAFRNLIVGGAGPFAPRGVDNPDPAATAGYMIGVDNSFFGLLQVRRISNPGGLPSISPNLPVPVPATAFPIDVPSNASAVAADALDDRLFAASLRRERGSGRTVLVTAHNIQVSSAGVASNSGGRDGCRWYRLTSLESTPTLDQAGTLFDPAPTNPRSYWIPTAVMTEQGHMALGCSAAAPTTWIGCSTAGRLADDPAGSTQTSTLIAGGVGAYFNNQGLFGRISAMCVDPVDDQSIWAFQEYMPASGVWGVRVARLVAPPPSIPVQASPASVAQGQNGVQVLIAGAAAGGFYDTEPGLARLQALFSGTGVQVVSATLVDPRHLLLTLNVSATAPLGPRSLTVINPDGQQVSSAAGLLGIDPGAVCPSFVANPVDAAPCEGTHAQFHAAVTGSPAPALQWRRNGIPLADGGAVSGATSPDLVIDPVAASDAGSYDCTAINACGSVASTSAQLSVGQAPVVVDQSGDARVWSGQAVLFTVQSSGATGFQWSRDGIALADGGAIRGTATSMLSINPASPSDSGQYRCAVSNDCGVALSRASTLIVDGCEANCDGSTTLPLLNVLDFACFLNLYATGDPRANCDGSTTPPVLNVLDFSCFLNIYAAGCS